MPLILFTSLLTDLPFIVDETIETESFPNKLRSIVGQMEHAYEWDCELGVPFRTHLYVPEKHPVTKRFSRT